MPSSSYRYEIELRHFRKVLNGVVEATSAWDAVMSTVDLDRLSFAQEPLGSNSDHRGLRRWREFAGRTPWLSDHRSFAESCSIASTDDILDRRQLVESSFYQNCLRPYDIIAGLILIIERSARKITWLHLLQTGPDPAFGTREVSLLRSLHPMLLETLRIARVMDDLEALRTSFADTIDHVAAGVALMTDQQVTCNQMAKTILAEQDGLQLVGGQLKASGDQQLALQEAIASARNGAPRNISITRPSGKCALDVSVRAVGHGRGDRSDKQHAVAVYIVVPGRGKPASNTYLRQAFELTHTEAIIATHLANGHSSADIAEGLGIDVETVRGHIKNILTKTRTSRQAELVALIANRPIT